MLRSDESLFERVCAGDLKSFDELYTRYERRLYGFILGQTGNVHVAEDLLHDTFLAVLRGGAPQDGVRSFKAWIFTVARNQCANWRRTQSRAADALNAVRQTPPAHQPSPESQSEARTMVKRVRAAAQTLPANLSEVFHLRAAGMSYPEIAEVLAVPEGTLRSRMHETMRWIRKEVSR